MTGSLVGRVRLEGLPDVAQGIRDSSAALFLGLLHPNLLGHISLGGDLSHATLMITFGLERCSTCLSRTIDDQHRGRAGRRASWIRSRGFDIQHQLLAPSVDRVLLPGLHPLSNRREQLRWKELLDFHDSESRSPDCIGIEMVVLAGRRIRREKAENVSRRIGEPDDDELLRPQECTDLCRAPKRRRQYVGNRQGR